MLFVYRLVAEFFYCSIITLNPGKSCDVYRVFNSFLGDFCVFLLFFDEIHVFSVATELKETGKKKKGKNTAQEQRIKLLSSPILAPVMSSMENSQVCKAIHTSFCFSGTVGERVEMSLP